MAEDLKGFIAENGIRFKDDPTVQSGILAVAKTDEAALALVSFLKAAGINDATKFSHPIGDGDVSIPTVRIPEGANHQNREKLLQQGISIEEIPQFTAQTTRLSPISERIKLPQPPAPRDISPTGIADRESIIRLE